MILPCLFQLGLGNNDKQTRPVFVTELADKDCIALTCGYYHSLALSADRCVWAWGWGVHGQLGFGNIEDYLVPARVRSLDNCSVIRLAAGYSHTAVLTSEVSMQIIFFFELNTTEVPSTTENFKLSLNDGPSLSTRGMRDLRHGTCMHSGNPLRIYQKKLLNKHLKINIQFKLPSSLCWSLFIFCGLSFKSWS